ncbi:MAG: hypothetical protein ACYTDT_10675, partial [Planctomycetota bacterium]
QKFLIQRHIMKYKEWQKAKARKEEEAIKPEQPDAPEESAPQESDTPPDIEETEPEPVEPDPVAPPVADQTEGLTKQAWERREDRRASRGSPNGRKYVRKKYPGR